MRRWVVLRLRGGGVYGVDVVLPLYTWRALTARATGRGGSYVHVCRLKQYLHSNVVLACSEVDER